jgi:hypothetical protein
LAVTEIFFLLLLALTKFLRRQNSRIDKISAATKSRHRQNLGIDKMLAQTQKKTLTVLHGRVHSC